MKGGLMKIIPTGDRLLVKTLKSEATIGGIFLPQKVEMKASVGEIISAGPGYALDTKNPDGTEQWEPTLHKVSQKILFFSKMGIVINDTFRLLHDKDVLAIIADDGIEVGESFSD